MGWMIFIFEILILTVFAFAIRGANQERDAWKREVRVLRRQNHELLTENIQLSSKNRELRLGVSKFDHDKDGKVGGSLKKRTARS